MKKKQNKNDDKINEKIDDVFNALKKVNEQKIDLEEEMRDYLELQISNIYISDIIVNVKEIEEDYIIELIVQTPSAWFSHEIEKMYDLLQKEEFVFFGMQPSKEGDHCYIEFKFVRGLNHETDLHFDSKKKR